MYALCLCPNHAYASANVTVIQMNIRLLVWASFQGVGALFPICEQLQHLVCLEHGADDDDMIREDKALFPEVYDEGC